MPKKPNFLGGMQNYNPKTGEYEPALVGSNGKVVKDADGDGVSHESKSHLKSSQEKQKFIEKINNLEWGDIVYGYDKSGNLININEYDEEKDKFLGYDGNLKPVELSYEETANLQRLGTKLGKNKQEQDFNDPIEAEHNKAEEKEFSEIKYEKKTDLESNEEIDWDLAEKNEKVNGSKGKSKTRKDKYGNPLLSDEAFKVGVEAGKEYLEKSLKYDSLESLKRSNVFLGYMENYINNAIVNNGYNPNLDSTYQDINEMIGVVTGEEVDMERYGSDATKGFTGKKYSGYNPLTSTSKEVSDFKLDKEKYPDVEETPYGYIYNVNGQSITNQKAMNKSFHDKDSSYPYDPNKEYGWSYTKDGDEVYAESFDDAYNAVKGKKEKYPKGTSKEYSDKINKQYEGAVKTLSAAGIKTDFKNFEEINKAQKDVMSKWEQSKDDAKYKPLYEALETIEDKMYNDDFIRLAPYGY